MLTKSTKTTILRRWKFGYRLSAIAREFCIGPTEAAKVIAASGVCWSAIASRERITSNERWQALGVSTRTLQRWLREWGLQDYWEKSK